MIEQADGSAHQPGTTLAAPLHNRSVQFIPPEPNGHGESNSIAAAVAFIVVLKHATHSAPIFGVKKSNKHHDYYISAPL